MNPNSYLRNGSNALAGGAGEPSPHFSHPLGPTHAANGGKAGRRGGNAEQQLPYPSQGVANPAQASSEQQRREGVARSGAMGLNSSAGGSLIHVTDSLSSAKGRGLEQYRPSPHQSNVVTSAYATPSGKPGSRGAKNNSSQAQGSAQHQPQASYGGGKNKPSGGNNNRLGGN